MFNNDSIKDFTDSFNPSYGWVLDNPKLVNKFIDLLSSIGDIDDSTKDDIVTIGLQLALSFNDSKSDFQTSVNDFMEMIS